MNDFFSSDFHFISVKTDCHENFRLRRASSFFRSAGRAHTSSSSITGQWSLPSTSLQMSAFRIFSFSRSETRK